MTILVTAKKRYESVGIYGIHESGYDVTIEQLFIPVYG